MVAKDLFIRQILPIFLTILKNIICKVIGKTSL